MPDSEGLLIAATPSDLSSASKPILRRRREHAPERTTWWQSFLDAGPIEVSVCIANWNCREQLRACLESLHDWPQGVRLETIVVDNASTDGAPDMVARDFPEVVLLRNRANLGFARANNQAADHARGRYVFFLNNDTLVPPDTLRGLVKFADAHPEVGMIGPRLRDARGQTQISYRLRPTVGTLLHRTSLFRWTGLFRGAYRRYRRDFDPRSTRPVEVLMGAALLMPRHVFIACGRWDEKFQFGGEDLDLSLQVSLRCSVVYHPEVEIIHYGRTSTRQHIGYASSQMIVGFARYLRKSGCSPTALVAYKTAVLLDAPLQLLGKSLQYGWRRLRGRRQRAEKSRLALRGWWHFLTRSLPAFLKA
jgi:GT2 family glycosyltransferase